MSSLSLKDYVYISDAKVDKFISQLPVSWLDRFDLKLKAGAPGLTAEVGRRGDSPDRFNRVARLCEALDDDGQIGTMLDRNARFFRGTMLATWGFWNRSFGEVADVVFFGGYPEQNVFVGIGGSAYHSLEYSTDRLQPYSNSGLQALMGFLKERSEKE